MEITKQTFFVLGAARSGLALVDYLLKHDAKKIFFYDQKPIEECIADEQQRIRYTDAPNLTLLMGEKIGESCIQEADMLLLSPSVPPTDAIVQTAKKHNIPVMTEIEFAYTLSKAPIIAITGTNGKTTTTTLIGEVMKAAKVSACVGGNIGYPLISCIDEVDDEGVLVAEISSYQLELCEVFHPKIAVITNITPDHLDRHGSFEEYTRVKYKVFAHQQSSDVLILNGDDPLTKQAQALTKAKCLLFSTQEKVHNGAYYNKKDGGLYLVEEGAERFLMLQKELKIPGLHNAANALCAILAGYAWGLALDQIIAAVKIFGGVAHRIEFVATKNDVEYINDSKGTNTDATTIAIKAMDKPVVLILGGYDKGGTFDALLPVIFEKVVHIITVGATAEKIETMLRKNHYEAFCRADDYEEVVRLAHQRAKTGQVVLLSPACASWDMFSCFEERGELFKKLVGEL